MIDLDLSKQQALDCDPKATKRINFTGNLVQQGNAIQQYFSLLQKQRNPF